MLRLFSLACLCFAFLSHAPSRAGEFSVHPIRVELGPSARSGTIAVRNDGKHKLTFQMAAREWTQDDAGKDQYTDTSDLVFFPKLMAVESEQEGIIRIGIKNAALEQEKTYRLFIEELPSADAAVPGVQLNVVIKFGAPVFVQPQRPQDGLDIGALSLSSGALSFAVRNTGNRHQMFRSIEVRGYDTGGQQVYGLVLADRYLLAGRAKPFTASVDAASCEKMAALEVDIRTDKGSARRKLDVTRAMCP